MSEELKACRAKNCENPLIAKELCSTHYYRYKKYGDINYIKQKPHGMSETTEYTTWCSMKQRCNYKKHKLYHRYGGRGIKVCERWNESFLDFYKDMGDKPFPKAQIDRIDNDGNYEPGNCRWTTSAENNRNRVNNILTIEQVREIRKNYLNNREMYKDIAIKYGVHEKDIGKIIRNESWKETAIIQKAGGRVE